MTVLAVRLATANHPGFRERIPRARQITAGRAGIDRALQRHVERCSIPGRKRRADRNVEFRPLVADTHSIGLSEDSRVAPDTLVRRDADAETEKIVGIGRGDGDTSATDEREVAANRDECRAVGP